MTPERQKELVKDLWLAMKANADHFTAKLFHLRHKADMCNRERLKVAFPDEMEVYEEWNNAPNENEFFGKYLEDATPIKPTTRPAKREETRVGRQPKYPRIAEFGLSIEKHIPTGISFIPVEHLALVLCQRGISDEFNKLFGCQTQFEGGPYAWDVEAVLERICSGKKTGSQALWD